MQVVVQVVVTFEGGPLLKSDTLALDDLEELLLGEGSLA